jgi:hypothetical protein
MKGRERAHPKKSKHLSPSSGTEISLRLSERKNWDREGRMESVAWSSFQFSFCKGFAVIT